MSVSIMKVALLCLCLVSAFWRISALPQQRVINGKLVKDIRLFPFSVFLDIGGGKCTASIIGRRKILTAAHCTCGRPVGRISARTSALNAKDARARKYRIVRKFEHPKFLALGKCNMASGYDVAVVETDRDIQTDDYARPISIDFRRLTDVTPVVTMGFGRDEKFKSGVLKYAMSHVNRCKLRDDNMLCASRKENSVFFGDSGGPLITCDSRSCRQIGINGAVGVFAYFVSLAEVANFVIPHL